MENLYASIFRENENNKDLIQTAVLKEFWDSFDRKFDEVLQKLWEEYPENFWLMSKEQREKILGNYHSVTFTLDLSKHVPQNNKTFVDSVKKKIRKLFVGEGFSVLCNAEDDDTKIVIEILYFSIAKLINVNTEKFASAPNFIQWVDKFKKRVSADKQKIEETELDVLNAKIDVLLDVLEESLKEVTAAIFILGEKPSNGFIEMPSTGDIGRLYPEAHTAFANMLYQTPFSLKTSNGGTVIQCSYFEFKNFYYEMLQAALYEQDVPEQGEARKRVLTDGTKKSEF